MDERARQDPERRKRPRSSAAHDEGNVERLRALHDAGCDVDTSDKNQVTPLLCAAKGGHTECVRFLLQCGADAHKTTFNDRGWSGWTLAHIAASQGNIEMLRASLDAGCDANAADIYGGTPLMYAVGSMECCQLLLQRGANVHQRQGNGWTLVHSAAALGKKEILLALIDAGCDVDATCGDDNVTPLMRAVEKGHTECVQLLLQRGANVHMRCRRDADCTLAHQAAERGNKEMLLVLIDGGCDVNATDNFKHTPLAVAAKKGHTDCVQLLLQRGADGKGSAHLAAEGGHTKTLLALLDAGCVDATGDEGRALLSCAAEHGHTDCVRVLLERGANVRKWTEHNWTAHAAAKQGNKEMLAALLDAGCDVDGTDTETPLICAAEGGQHRVRANFTTTWR